MSMQARVVAFVRLLEEGTEVYRPVDLEMLGDDNFRIVGPEAEDEKWEFSPGDVVSLIDHTTSTGERIKLIVAGGLGRSA